MPNICLPRNMPPKTTLGMLTCAAIFLGCSSEEPPGFIIEDDFVPPSPVLDLRVSSRDDSTLTLLWTSPGDDGTEGRAWRYDVRRSDEPIDEVSWDGATTIRGEPFPSYAGRTELFLLLGLGPTERYFFSLRTADEWGNLSELSNVAEAAPLDRTPPGQITDLEGVVVGPNEVELSWTATGDDGGTGRAAGYVVRFASFEFGPENFGEAALLSPSPVPRVAGESERFRVMLDAGQGPSFWFALQAWDEVSQSGPVSNVARVVTRGVPGAAGGAATGTWREGRRE